MQTLILLATAILTSFYCVTCWLLGPNHGASEPPILSSKVPFIGHILGLLKHKTEYYVNLRKKHGLSIYSLDLAGSIVYVVTSTELVKAVQKHPKALAFPPVAAQFAMVVCASSEKANSILKTNVNGEEGDWGYAMTFYKILHPSLAPGPALDAMNRAMIHDIAACLERLAPAKGAHTRIKLGGWLRHEITMATTNAVYGPMNPFKNSEVEWAFWEFQDDLTMILVDVLPKYTAWKGYKARNVLINAFDEYFRQGHHRDGSVLVRERYRNSKENKIPLNDIARYEVGGSIAILVNTTPATFWVLLYIYANEKVLQAVRQEVTDITNISTDAQGKTIRCLDVTKLKRNCHLLVSTFTEVLRHRTLGTSVRKVTQDMMLDGKHLLKKDRTLIMPSRVLHTDPDIWGSDVDEFKPFRFAQTARPEGPRLDPVAFRAFGGGSTLCPGRHFSTMEILAVVTMAVMRYDIQPAEGRWTFPTTYKSNIVAAVMEPDRDIEVDVRHRVGFEEDRWAFQLTDSEAALAVTVEDRMALGT